MYTYLLDKFVVTCCNRVHSSEHHVFAQGATATTTITILYLCTKENTYCRHKALRLLSWRAHRNTPCSPHSLHKREHHSTEASLG